MIDVRQKSKYVRTTLSQCRVFLFKPNFSSISMWIVFAYAASSLLISLSGCVLRDSKDSGKSSAQNSVNSDKASLGLKGKPVIHVFGSRTSSGQQRYVGQVTLESCGATQAQAGVTSSLIFSTELKTLWNTNKTVHVRYTRSSGPQNSLPENSELKENFFMISQMTPTRDKTFETALTDQASNSHLLRIFSNQLDGLCQDQNRLPAEIQLNQTETEFFSELIQDSTSDCTVKFEEIGPRCHTSSADTIYLAEALQTLRKLTVQQSNRHPYFLARRLGSAIQFAEFLDSIKRKDSATIASRAEKFCKLMRFSKTDEWPLALQTDTFRRFVCSASPLTTPDSEAFLEAAFVYSKRELELMTLLLKSMTHSGMISVNLNPEETTAKLSRDLRLVLKPEPDVLAKITEKLRANNLTGAYASKTGNCWHPYFDDSRTAVLATAIGLIHSHPAEKCPVDNSKSISAQVMDANRYLLSALASETEFVLTNGRGKIIRLPVGNYTFEIFPDTDDRVQNSKLILTETFEWQNRAKPMIAIRNYGNKRISH